MHHISFRPISKAKSAIYASLGSAKMRRRHGLFMAEGEKCVADTIGHFQLQALIITDNSGYCVPDRINPDKVFVASEAIIGKISTLSNSPSVIAVYQLPEPEHLCINKALYLLLDGVQDPGNFGTILRLADWFGIHSVFASRNCVDIFNPKTIQASMGAISRVHVEYTDLAELISAHPELPVYGLLLQGTDIYKASLKSYGFIIMGNEGSGISPQIRSLVTSPLLIPPYPALRLGTPECSESLNVAMATAITLSEFRRR